MFSGDSTLIKPHSESVYFSVHAVRYTKVDCSLMYECIAATSVVQSGNTCPVEVSAIEVVLCVNLCISASGKKKKKKSFVGCVITLFFHVVSLQMKLVISAAAVSVSHPVLPSLHRFHSI